MKRVRSRPALQAALALTTLAMTATTAQAVSPDAVIGEAYGGGGNSGAELRQDFVELANRSATAVSVAGWSVQYLPPTASPASAWQVTPLTGTLPASGRYLVAQAEGAGGTVALPTPDATGTTAMSGTAGTVALVRTTTALTCKTSQTCAADATVVDILGYGGSTVVREGTSTANLSNTTSASRTGTPPVDSDDNVADFVLGEPTPRNAAGQGPVQPPATPATIEQIQGTGFVSDLVGDRVSDVEGVVTARRSNGYYLQQVDDRDTDARTSPGLFVFTNGAPPSEVVVGRALSLTGTVSEFRPAATAQSTTQLTNTTIDADEAGTVPAPLPLPTVPAGAFASASGDTEAITAMQPIAAALDYWEAREGALVTTDRPSQVTGPTSSFNETIVLLGDPFSAPRTARGGIAITRDDYNPERVKLEGLPVSNVPVADVGDRYGQVTGVVDHDFNVPTIFVTRPTTVTDGGLQRETTDAQGDGELAVATFNVENLSPVDQQTKFAALGAQIVDNLAAPDVVALEEVQDDNGPANDSVVDAGVTLDRLVAAIAAAGGPAYEWRQISPTDDADGGQPGGNIRNAFLFRTDRGLEFVDRPGGDATTPVTVGDGPALSASPGRIDPGDAAWAASRKPLAGEFRWQGRPLFVVGNHFNSKGGDQPLFGRNQPPSRSSEVQRRQQAQLVNGFVDELLAADPQAHVVVLGDINDFQFSDVMADLTAGGALVNLASTLPESEGYTYVFEGNSQALDHILLSPGLAARPYEYDIVHTNAEFADQLSDHDPQVVRLGTPAAPPADGQPGAPQTPPGQGTPPGQPGQPGQPGPGTPPGGGSVAPPGAADPRLRDVPRRITNRARRLSPVVTCPATRTARCRGQVVVRTASGRALGSRRFSIRPGGAGRVRVGLSARRLRTARRIVVTVRVSGETVRTARIRVLRRR